jgi:superfamily I DNA/RNA helicase
MVRKSKLDEGSTIAEYEQWLDKWATGERRKLQAKEEWSKLGLLEDKIATLMCFVDDLDSTATIRQLIQSIEALFKDDGGGVTLATVHKAKGMEYNRVFVLDAHELMPCPWAKRPSDASQELNLCYVAATRAKRELYYIESKRLA